MRRIETVAELRAALLESPRPLGLVPTMGALHAGHVSLIRAARSECATVAVSIFVNPAQFGPGEDFERYPRPLAADLALLEIEGADYAYTPSPEEMYPPGFATSIHVEGPALPLEGAARPGHFDGVATAVAKLLLQAQPDKAYFGQKDAQQVAVIRQLVRDLNIPTEIAALPTVREPDGLAVSSRNAYLTAEERIVAPSLYRALAAARDKFRAGQQNAAELEAACREMIEASPLMAAEYAAAVDPETMEPWDGRGPCLLAAAARLGSVRLIDNALLE